MIKILIIADDFTGALDSGVKFSAAGFTTKVVTDLDIDFAGETEADVLVLCTPTRHIPAAEAYHVIRRITQRAVQARVGCIFKKTDSALRGNIGAELSAALDGSGQQSISFIPALPTMNRVTEGGVHYIDGVPVQESVFGRDPFEPVTESYVPDLLAKQCDVPIRVISREKIKDFRAGERCIYLFDCTCKEDLEEEVEVLHRQGQTGLLAGCSGLAEILPAYLGTTSGERAVSHPNVNRMIVVCGSLNPISCEQMDYAERYGFHRIHISPDQLLDGGSLKEGAGKALIDQLWRAYCLSEYLLIDTQQLGADRVTAGDSMTLEEIRQRLSGRLGIILKTLLDLGADSRFIIIGGDTLLAFMDAIQCRELYPVQELMPGVVLSLVPYRNRQYEVISKSGGFGERDLLVALRDIPECRTPVVV